MQRLIALCLLTLVGCAEFPGVYRIDIEQGNVVNRDMIKQLRSGMTQRQVRFIMGTPLIEDTFNQQRWDYLHSIQPGGEKRRQERLTLIFDQEGRLSSSESPDFILGQIQ